MHIHPPSQARSLVVALFIAAVFCAGLRSAAAQVTLPPGFSETLIAPVTDPTAMQFAPDGRLFVCEQGGTLRVIKDGVILPTPFVTLSVSSVGDAGCLAWLSIRTSRSISMCTSTTPRHHRRFAIASAASRPMETSRSPAVSW